MKIAGLVKTSLIDYPGNVAAVVFTQGCNFRCGFCHNPELLDSKKETTLSEDYFFNFLNKRKGILDGVVITGGEPTLQVDLVLFIKKIKAAGFKVKLDTNGTNPRVLKKLLTENLVDYVAMDIKGPFETYEKICGPVSIETVRESVSALIASDIEFEFRTTALPFYHTLQDFEKIGIIIKGAKRYVIQGFRPEITYKNELHFEKPFGKSDLEAASMIVSKYVNEVVILDNLT